MNDVFRYFTNLEFLWNEYTFGPNLARRRELLTLMSYVLLSLGLFARQITSFPHVDINFTNLRWPVLAASFIIGLALFPPIMRFVNKRRQKPGIEQAITAFGVGFFVDLANGTLFHPLWEAISKAMKI
jgi:hypothetical protein